MLQRTAGHHSAGECWRMAHPSSSDGDHGSRQRAWTKSLKALRHFASDRVADEKLMERGFLNLWEKRHASKAQAFREKVDEHTDQSLVDRDKDGERTKAQWENLVPQAREWLDEQKIRPSR